MTLNIASRSHGRTRRITSRRIPVSTSMKPRRCPSALASKSFTTSEGTHHPMRFRFATLLLATCFAFTAHGQNAPTNNPSQFDTRPTANNDTTLRPLSPEEIPPNLNFYAVDPLYRADAPLGWAKERIEERIGRGLVARSLEAGKVYLSWR